MFKELTNELLDLTASVRGEKASHFAMVLDCCSSSSCACLFLCF